jgi:DNA-binding protein H-NS
MLTALAEAEKRATEAEKRATEAEKRATEAEARCEELEDIRDCLRRYNTFLTERVAIKRMHGKVQGSCMLTALYFAHTVDVP